MLVLLFRRRGLGVDTAGLGSFCSVHNELSNKRPVPASGEEAAVEQGDDVQEVSTVRVVSVVA